MFRRTPIRHPLSRRAIRSSRSFSTSYRTAARHRDDGSEQPSADKKPDGVDELERLRERHLRRWRRHIEEDPYRALFGASEDMLGGKGLEGWRREWVGWVVRDGEMGREGEGMRGVGGEGKGKVREGVFAQPGARTGWWKGTGDAGVVSPSDERRPREQPVVVRAEESTVSGNEGQKNGVQTLDKDTNTSGTRTSQQISLPNEHHPEDISSTEPQATVNDESNLNKETLAQEMSFIEEFLADKPQASSSIRSGNEDWRQTVLERRAKEEITLKPRRRAQFPVIDVAAKDRARAEKGAKEQGIPESNCREARIDAHVNPPNITSHRLDQLPKDDLDLLTAEEIRASMGRPRGVIEDKSIIRQKLEEGYRKNVPELDPMVEAQVVNDQYVRRKRSQLAQVQEQTEAAEISQPATTQKQDNPMSKPISVLETSLDFMSRWLHTGGNMLAQHFWQDPVQLVTGQLSGANEEFLKGISIGVVKGRRAFASIKEELVADIPASKELVARLNRDEVKASAGAVKLYRELPSALKDVSDAAALETAAHVRIGKLRQALLETDNEFKEACDLVDGMKSTNKPSFRLEKRLRLDSDVLRKNARLTRMAVFGLQARIEVEAATSGGLVARELLHRLLTLQDTQLALSRLVTRTMHVLGIDPKAAKEASPKSEASTADLADPTVAEALASTAAQNSSSRYSIDTAAANEKLELEVKKHKAAMRGLSDDGYSRTPKPATRKPLDGPNPLAHSLFRPFGLQLDSLGKDADAEKEGAVDAARKKKADKELVREVRRAYEDVYGAISVDHWQVPPNEIIKETEKTPEMQEGRRQTSIQMLKEDDVSPSVTAGASPAEMNTAPTSHPSGKTPAEANKNKTSPPIEDTPKDQNQKRTPVTGGFTDKHDDCQPVSLEDVKKFGRGYPTDDGNRKPPRESASTASETPPKTASADARCSTSFARAYRDTVERRNSSSEYYIRFYYDAKRDKLSIHKFLPMNRSQPDPPTPMPLLEALRALTHPEKFINHLPEKPFDVMHCETHTLTVRAVADDANIAIKEPEDAARDTDAKEPEVRRSINPIDGTTTLSPTGFVGVGSDLERELEFEERRRKAYEYNKGKNEARKVVGNEEEKEKGRGRGRGGAGAVVKTAIWATAACYVVGVLAELAK